MKEKILLVDDVVEITEACSRVLRDSFEVHTASDADEALKECERHGPFAVVISDDDMPGMKGVELLAKIHETSPSTVRMMLTGLTDLEVAVQALHQGRIFRFLTKPLNLESLRAAVDEAVQQHRGIKEEDRENQELLYSNKTLQGFTQALEERIAHQAATQRRMHQFAADLNSVNSLQEVADLVAETASAVLAGRGTHVQIWDPESPGVGAETGRGPEMSSNMHREVMQTKEGRIGELVVDVVDPLGGSLTEDDREVLRSIASSAAIASGTEFGRRERDRAQHATIIALARLAEQRDNETGKHLERVSLYCTLLAKGLRELGADDISDEFIEDLARSAPLHDIGKVGIPDSILLKPGKLTPEEWVIMKTHAEIGAATIDSVIKENPDQTYLKMARDIAWCHHEKWNGTGYPRGLKGEEIPLPARILMVADVYDALTSVRPYKSAWSHRDALEWIKSYSGTHFDPTLVEALIAKAKNADRIRERLADHVEEMAGKALGSPTTS